MKIYREFKIYCDPQAIGDRAFDWDYVHVNYDGPEDGRCGHSLSFEGCIELIDEHYDELEVLPSCVAS